MQIYLYALIADSFHLLVYLPVCRNHCSLGLGHSQGLTETLFQDHGKSWIPHGFHLSLNRKHWKEDTEISDKWYQMTFSNHSSVILTNKLS